MGSSPSAPTPTDPNTVATNQQTLNTNAAQQSQLGSMTNQTTPYGSLTYSQTGTGPNGTPIYTANTTLSPAEQALLTQLQSTQGTAGSQASQLLTAAAYGTKSPTDVIGNATSGLVQQAMGQQVNYLQPFFDQQTSQLDTQLRNQGFAPGTPGYDNAMQNLTKSQGATVTNFESTIEPQMFQQATQDYTLPLTLAQAELGISAPTGPQFQNTPQLNIQPANLVGATANYNQAEQQTYEDQMQQNNAMMSGLFGIPTAILGGWAKGGGVQSLMGSLPMMAASSVGI